MVAPLVYGRTENTRNLFAIEWLRQNIESTQIEHLGPKRLVGNAGRDYQGLDPSGGFDFMKNVFPVVVVFQTGVRNDHIRGLTIELPTKAGQRSADVQPGTPLTHNFAQSLYVAVAIEDCQDRKILDRAGRRHINTSKVRQFRPVISAPE
jgi:hypothetical protein